MAGLQLDRRQAFRAPREASVCRPGRTLVGVVAQPVGATVRAAHALCLRGVEVALADHPGGLVAGELQRGGGGQELHQRGRIAIARGTTVSFLHRFGECFGADTQRDRKRHRDWRATARRAAAAPSIRERLRWHRAALCSVRMAQSSERSGCDPPYGFAWAVLLARQRRAHEHRRLAARQGGARRSAWRATTGSRCR